MRLITMIALTALAIAMPISADAQNRKGPDGCAVGDRECCQKAVTRINQQTPGAYIQRARRAAVQRCLAGQSIR